jgi:putative DNA primase/helicase
MNQEKFTETERVRKLVGKRILALQTVARKEYVLKLARTGENSLAIRGDEWDKDEMLLGVQNGVIDLKTGELRPGKPDDYIKTAAPCRYYGLDYTAPTWERFLAEIFGNDKELVNYVQRLLGYGITGKSNNHKLPIFWGPQGRNGKGTILETLKFVLGELIHKTRAEALMTSRYPPPRGAADADTIAFRGKRIIWASETGDGKALDAERIKELSGGDTLNARAPYGKRSVEFSPTHLLILLTNNRPKAPAQDDALWDRLHLVPFNLRYIDDPRESNERLVDHDLPEKLKKEAPGIMAWLVRGCLQWQQIGLAPPEIVKATTKEYRKDEDEIRQFIADICDRVGNENIPVKRLHEMYRTWHHEMGLTGEPMSMKKLSPRIVSLGYERNDTGRIVYFKGIGSRAVDA